MTAGNFDPTICEFKNLSVEHIVAEMNSFIQKVVSLRPALKILLTVTPVPLAATALDRHVLVSTAYFKSVLSVAAELIQGQWKDNIAHFSVRRDYHGEFFEGLLIVRPITGPCSKTAWTM